MSKTLAVAVLATLILAGCAGKTDPGAKGRLSQAGSSTVLPLAEAWAEELAADGIQVVVAGGGSGAGASKLCAKEIQLGDMSRPMKDAEIEECKANGVDPVAWKVAYDGLTVVVNKQNDFVDHLTVSELQHVWRSEAPAQTWADVRAGWPAEKIVLYGPDSDSGTYEYFNEEIIGKTCGADQKQACPPRNDYTPSANDDVVVEGVAASKYAVGHFGFAYFERSAARLIAVPIQGKDAAAPVPPSFDTIADGTYTPLGRPLFVYTDGVPSEGDAVHTYLQYVFTDGQIVIREVGYVEMDQDTLTSQLARL